MSKQYIYNIYKFYFYRFLCAFLLYILLSGTIETMIKFKLSKSDINDQYAIYLK